MRLVLYSDEHRWLTEALETDPVAMRELGGAVPAGEIDSIHARRLASVTSEPWWFAVELEPAERPVGLIGIWTAEHEGETLHEAGWMLLPEVHGRGVATAALAQLLAAAREDSPFERVHAFPGVANAASNALCARAGFERLEERDVVYRGKPLRVAHWALHLAGR